MKFQRFNWQIWAGFLLSLIAFLSYPFVFVRFPATRDFPWASLLLFGVAMALLLLGIRRAWKSSTGVVETPLISEGDARLAVKKSRRSKIVASVLATLSVAILGLFVFSTFVVSRWLPASHGAPQIGQKAPDFTLSDTNGKAVSLSELLASPTRNERETPTSQKGVLLIFYRGYW